MKSLPASSMLVSSQYNCSSFERLLRIPLIVRERGTLTPSKGAVLMMSGCLATRKNPWILSGEMGNSSSSLKVLGLVDCLMRSPLQETSVDVR